MFYSQRVIFLIVSCRHGVQRLCRGLELWLLKFGYSIDLNRLQNGEYIFIRFFVLMLFPDEISFIFRIRGNFIFFAILRRHRVSLLEFSLERRRDRGAEMFDISNPTTNVIWIRELLFLRALLYFYLLSPSLFLCTRCEKPRATNISRHNCRMWISDL